jgi:hypothetical protein
MIQSDPIIAVKDISASAKWYENIFGCRRMHDGEDFAVMMAEDDTVLICLHQWQAHGHPTMADPSLTAGNGLILYFRTGNMNEARNNATKLGAIVEEDIHVNPNSAKKEFSLRDPDGYYLTITEFHTYEG